MNRRAFAMPEMLGALILLGLLASLTVGAGTAARGRGVADARSARLEEAQNLLARWRAGEAVAGDGWSVSVTVEGTVETIELRGHGLRLCSLRTLPGGVR